MSWDGVFASTICATPATTGCHMLKIDGYSQTSKLLRNGSHAMSCKFEAAGETWCIMYYPNGCHTPGADDHISLYLKLVPKVGTTTINAKVRFSLVPHNGKPAPYCKSFTAVFSPALVLYISGIACFVKREVLEKSEYLLDDCFAVRCDIDAVKMSTVADPNVKAHDLERLGLPCSCDDDLCKCFRLDRTVEPASPSQHRVNKSPAVADHACSCKDNLCKRCTVEAASASTPAAPPQRHRGVMAAWFRLFGCGKI